VAEAPNTRSVKIDSDERGGWSSDRPRRGGPAPPNISARCRLLSPSESLRYSPGSMLLVLSPSAERRDALAGRVVQGRASHLSLDKVRRLLEGRVPEELVEAQALELLAATLRKRLAANEAAVVTADGLDEEQRERFARIAAEARRPRHVILVDPPAAEVSDEDRPALNELRRRLEAGELGAEGFQTALRVGGSALDELKRIVFASEPRDE
jgi:hypothetical protein